VISYNNATRKISRAALEMTRWQICHFESFDKAAQDKIRERS